MLTILHGDDEVKSHSQLQLLLANANKKNTPVVRLDAKGLQIGQLEQAVGTDQLFTTEKLVVITGLFSLPKSKAKDTLIAWIRDRELAQTDLVLIEKKELTPTQIKQFPKARVEKNKIPMLLFSWLENLGVEPSLVSIQTLQKIVQTQEPEFCFAMIVRQVRQLLLAKSGDVESLSPFVRSKLLSQAKYFSMEKLLQMHEQLLTIDTHQKTSTSLLSLTEEIEVFLLSLQT